MDLEFTEFIGKAPRLEAIQVTAENVEALAVWMGADSYSVDKILVGGDRKVTFNKIIKARRDNYPDHVDRIVCTRIGNWLVRVPEKIENENGSLYGRDVCFISYTQEEIDAFVAQQRDNGEVDLNKE